jgi:hypothetical protein
MWLGGLGGLLVMGGSSPGIGGFRLLEGLLCFDGLELGSGSCEPTSVRECAGILHSGGDADGIGCCHRYIDHISKRSRGDFSIIALHPAPLHGRVGIVLHQVGRRQFVPPVLPPFGNLIAIKRPLVVFEPCHLLAAL